MSHTLLDVFRVSLNALNVNVYGARKKKEIKEFRKCNRVVRLFYACAAISLLFWVSNKAGAIAGERAWVVCRNNNLKLPGTSAMVHWPTLLYFGRLYEARLEHEAPRFENDIYNCVGTASALDNL